MDSFEGLPPVRKAFAAKADACRPELSTLQEHPLGLVRAEKDSSALLGWKAVPEGPLEGMAVLNAGDSVIVDFGGHRTGFLSFNLVPYKHSLEPADSPARLRIVFGEIFNDVAESLEPYQAWLSRAWLPDEIINVDYLPQTVSIPRRHAFRYVRFDIIATSLRFGVKIVQPTALAVSSAPPQSNPAPLTFSAAGQSLSAPEKDMLRAIDDAALLTLRSCMQTVYEDGPRRDMRLWIGDLRLQALTNYVTFKDSNLAKRCLYLFAATPLNENGLLSASCFEKPQILSGGQSIVDYSQLYAVALLDYVKHSGDMESGKELFPIALKQFEISLARCNPDTGLYVQPPPAPGGPLATAGDAWHFIDWQEQLDKTTPVHCVIVFGLKSLLALSELLQIPTPTLHTPFSQSSLPLTDIIAKLTSAARTSLYDSNRGVYISGPTRQLSWASNAWAVLAGIPTSRSAAAHAMRTTYADPTAVIAATPYLHHYLCEAFIEAGLDDLAVAHILKYWGSMIDAGAKTFWEAWDPARPTFSPYGDFHSNSFCHAWSCTPALLLRRLGFA